MFSRVTKYLLAALLLAAPLAFAQGQGQFGSGSSSGGSGTVSNCAAAGNAFYSGAGTTTTCDTNIVDSGSGGMTFSAAVTHITSNQGSLAVNTPWASHTATWNAAAAFTDFSNTITCTAANANSSLLNYIVGGNSFFNLNFAASNCGTPVLDLASSATVTLRLKPGTAFIAGNAESFAFSSTAAASGALDTCMDRSAAKVVRFDGNSACNDGLGTAQVGLLTSTSNCSNSAGTCGAAPAGAVTIAASATTVTVATTAVTANSDITVTEDSSIGTRLSVTCNTTTGRTYSVTTKTAGTSFVITTNSAPATNPACLVYHIWN